MKTFFKTVAVVTIFSICEKCLGFLYRIYMSRTIGTEGIGMYQIALSVFALIFTICCSGTPITVSRLMMKYKMEGHFDRVKRVISAGLFFTVIVVVPVCVVLYFFGSNLSFLFADSRCFSIFRVMLPGLVFTSVYAVLRGVFWGNKDFLPYSIIELLEEVCMIVVGIVLISFADSVYQGAYRAGLAVLISYVFSFLLATIVFFARKNRLKNPFPELKPLLASAVPITAMRTANSMIVSLVSIILPSRLILAGMTAEQAMSIFGAAVGQAIPILFIPTTLIGSFTLVLVPEISEHYYANKHNLLKRDIEKSIKFAVTLTCLFIPVFFVCGQEIGIIVFNSHESGKYLSVSAFLMLFMSLSSITTSMLNSIGLEKRTLLYFIISAVFMLLSIWFLPYLIGIYSLLIGFTFVFGLTTVLNLILLQKKCKSKPKYLRFCGIAVVSIIPSAILGLMLRSLLIKSLGTVLTCFLVSGIIITFNALLYVGFGLIDLKRFIEIIKDYTLKKRKKPVINKS